MSVRRSVLPVAAALLTVITLWAFWLEPASFRVETYAIELERLPNSCNGLRVCPPLGTRNFSQKNPYFSG